MEQVITDANIDTLRDVEAGAARARRMIDDVSLVCRSLRKALARAQSAELELGKTRGAYRDAEDRAARLKQELLESRSELSAREREVTGLRQESAEAHLESESARDEFARTKAQLADQCSQGRVLIREVTKLKRRLFRADGTLAMQDRLLGAIWGRGLAKGVWAHLSRVLDAPVPRIQRAMRDAAERSKRESRKEEAVDRREAKGGAESRGAAESEGRARKADRGAGRGARAAR